MVLPKKENAEYHELLKNPGPGPGGPHDQQGRSAFRRPAPGSHPADGDPEKPKLLLLDEHTAALDPKTAAKVLEISNKIVQENHLTTLMITHNMRDAIRYGNRLIMMNEGHVIYDVRGEEKTKLEVSDLLQRFEQAGGEANDRMILS